MNKQMTKELVTYLNIRFKYLRKCSTSVEGFFDREYKKYALKSTTDKSIKKALQDIYVEMNTFRYCMLVAVCSFVEEFLKYISTLIISNYHKKIKKYRGSQFKKHIELLKSDATIDFSPIESEIDFFEDIITVRNAIVHAWGKVDKVRNTKKLGGIIRDHKNNGWIGKDKNDYILLSDQALPEVRIRVQKIVQHLLKQ